MKILDWFFAARPLLHVPVWSVFLVGLHYHHQLSGGTFQPVDLLLMVSLSLLFAAAFYVNQVFDRESDRINRKGGFLESGLISERAMMASYPLLSILALASTLLLSAVTLVIFLQIVVLALIYSAPPVRLKDRPAGGLFANAYAHGFLVSLAVMPEMTMHNAGLLGWDNPFYFALAVGAVYILTTIPDEKGDRLTGKRTLAVIFGRTGSLVASLVLMLASAYVARESGFFLLFSLSAFAAVTIVAALVWRTLAAVRLAAKLPLLLLTALAGFWYPGYFVFIVALLVGTRIYYKKRFGVVYPKVA
ncbi:MAG TPA: UbiA family prenyltransferase [Acidobacteriota bacterium]|nr:UbiA family prenyltransferase [Acidobacteriota bacterium]